MAEGADIHPKWVRYAVSPSGTRSVRHIVKPPDLRDIPKDSLCGRVLTHEDEPGRPVCQPCLTRLAYLRKHGYEPPA